MTFLSRNTRFNSRHFWVCYQALNTFNDVCLTVFVEGFLNFKPVAPGNWAVTDVSSIEPVGRRSIGNECVVKAS